MQFEAVTTSRKSSLLSGALALCSVIGVMFTASPAGAMLWSPGNSPLAAALGSVTEACQAPVAFAPGYEGDHPLQRLNRAIVASVAGAESKIQSIDFSAAANPPQKAQCMVIYYAQEGQYLPEPLNSFTNLPRSLQPPAVNVRTESNLPIAGWRIESLDNGIVTYRRDAGRPVTGRRQDTY